MPRQPRKEALTKEHVLHKCEQLQDTPLGGLATLIAKLVENLSLTDGGWDSEAPTNTLRYTDKLLSMLPATVSDRFVFDTLLIQELATLFSAGNLVAMSGAIVPIYGEHWQLKRWPLYPERAELGQSIELLTIHGSDEISDVDLRDYPQLVHEMLHSVIYKVAGIVRETIQMATQPILDELHLASVPDRNASRDRHKRFDNRLREVWNPTSDQRNWSHELLIDIISLAIAGPSYALWFLGHTQRPSLNPFELVQTHPPFAVRMSGLHLAADALGLSVAEDLDRRRQQWDHTLPIKSNEYLNLTNPDVVDRLVDAGLQLVARLKLPTYTQTRWDTIGSRALDLVIHPNPLDLVASAFHVSATTSTEDYHAWLDKVIELKLRD